MSFITLTMLLVFVSCASLPRGPGKAAAYAPPTLGPQMEMDNLRDFHIDRLR